MLESCAGVEGTEDGYCHSQRVCVCVRVRVCVCVYLSAYITYLSNPPYAL